MRMLVAIVCAVALLGFVGADDKAKTYDAKVCCIKCELNKADKCATVVTIKEGDKEEIYYFDADSNKKFPHKDYCQGCVEAKVTGKLSEKDGKKFISVSKIDKKS
jgi:hypothetical protein